MKVIHYFFLFILWIDSQPVSGQNTITLEGIWKDKEFEVAETDNFKFSRDGIHYTQLVDNRIERYDIANGVLTMILFDASKYKGVNGFNGVVEEYEFDDKAEKILIATDQEKIYRRSTRSDYFVYDMGSRSLIRIYNQGKISNPSFSPNGEFVAFTHDNNLYFRDLSKNLLNQITRDGIKNEVINGMADWVYEEEFGFTRAFAWSPDSKKIAFIRFDESEVKEFSMKNYRDGSYPVPVLFKYPKVGEQNARVDVLIYHLDGNNQIRAQLGEMDQMYIPRIQWTRDDNRFVVTKLNRHQNHLQLIRIDARNGRAELLLEERNQHYIDIDDDLTFLDNGRQFIWSSEKDGFNRLWLYDMDGREIKAINTGPYEIHEFYGVDEDNHTIYFQSSEKSSLERQVYSVHLESGQKQLLTDFAGINHAEFSPSFSHFLWERSTINDPPSYSLCDRRGSPVRELEGNGELKAKQASMGVQPVEFFDFETEERVKLNGYMIKPAEFKENKHYPVLMYVYGGPGSQMVTDGWKGDRYWWFQMLSQNGYLIACVDNRGTGGRGEEFKKMTQLQLGHFETLDQIEAAKYLGGLPYVDEKRIGIFGWSYGGFMATSCILKGNDVFKAALAVAPVTNWKWYDTIYTERFMRTEEENPDGYRDNSPVYFADRLRGNYFLAHGISDDNVHFQHSAEMALALIKANKLFDSYFYPNQAHSISEENARWHLYASMTNFIFNKL